MRLKEIKPGMVIHCKTEEEFKTLKEYLIRNFYIFKSKEIQTNWKGIKYSYGIGLEEYGNATDEISFSDNDFYLRNGYGITEFSDLIIPELSAAEVPAILYEICEEYSSGRVNCNPDCPFAFHGMECDQYRAENGQRVVEICEQWKIDHEKKEPELEWVDICRIIEVQDNGKKVCVHEEDIKDADLPFGYKECTAELILKEYMKSHDGNYFATVEHVCRVKGEK